MQPAEETRLGKGATVRPDPSQPLGVDLHELVAAPRGATIFFSRYKGREYIHLALIGSRLANTYLRV